MDTKSVLIIDDDPELCAEMAECLQDAGWSTRTVTDSVLGLSLIEDNAHRLVILDYKMPGLNGIDLLKKIKSKSPRPAVIIMSGRPFIDQLLKRERVSDLVDGFLAKPFAAEALLPLARRLISR
jgi:DNA-binding NtrC family response regulator